MSFRLPSEIVAEQVLPTIRTMLAASLSDDGFTQEEIADHLGVTQAAVSAYVSGQVNVDDRIRTHPRTVETVDRITAGLAQGDMDGYDALSALIALIRDFEDRGPICELHEAAMPVLRGMGCDLCVRGVDTDLATERQVLAQVRKAARRFASISGVNEHVPNVGTNIGMALPAAASTADVAAIPGRIYVIRGRVEIPANPEFGASRHVATAILSAMHVDSGIRGAVNLKTDDDLLGAAADSGLESVEFDPAYEDREHRLIDRLTDVGTVPTIVYHRGAFGIEPVLYVLASTAIGAVELVDELLGDR